MIEMHFIDSCNYLDRINYDLNQAAPLKVADSFVQVGWDSSSQ